MAGRACEMDDKAKVGRSARILACWLDSELRWVERNRGKPIGPDGWLKCQIPADVVRDFLDEVTHGASK